MKALMCGFGLVFLGAVLLGSSGCGSDNEAEAIRAQGGKGAEGGTPADAPKYSSYEDYAKSRKNPYEGTKFDSSKASAKAKK